MAKIKCRTQVDSTGTENIVNDIRDWGVLIIVLYKLMKLFHIKDLLRGLFTKAINLFPYLWVPLLIWLAQEWITDWPGYFMNTSAGIAPLKESAFWSCVWSSLNVIGIIFVPWGIAWIIWAVRKIHTLSK